MRIIKSDTGNEVKVFAETFENEAYEQVKRLANYEAYQNSIIRIMPDSHAGKGCTVGTTMTITDKVTPQFSWGGYWLRYAYRGIGRSIHRL